MTLDDLAIDEENSRIDNDNAHLAADDTPNNHISDQVGIPTFDDIIYINKLRMGDPAGLDDLMDTALLTLATPGLKSSVKNTRDGRAMSDAKRNGDGTREIVLPPVQTSHLDVFNASSKYYEFQYLRFVHHQGVFDLPKVSLVPEDIDHLYTCGFLSSTDIDFAVGQCLLGIGAYKRIACQTGQPLFDGKRLPPPRAWTIANDAKRPTLHQLGLYFADVEKKRMPGSEKQREESQDGFFFEGDMRPRFTQEWVDGRIAEHGLYGLQKYAGVDDDRALAFINMPDPTFIPPTTLARATIDEFPGIRKPTSDEQFPVPPSSVNVSFLGYKKLLRKIERPTIFETPDDLFSRPKVVGGVPNKGHQNQETQEHQKQTNGIAAQQKLRRHGAELIVLPQRADNTCAQTHNTLSEVSNEGDSEQNTADRIRSEAPGISQPPALASTGNEEHTRKKKRKVEDEQLDSTIEGEPPRKRCRTRSQAAQAVDAPRRSSRLAQNTKEETAAPPAPRRSRSMKQKQGTTQEEAKPPIAVRSSRRKKTDAPPAPPCSPPPVGKTRAAKQKKAVAVEEKKVEVETKPRAKKTKEPGKKAQPAASRQHGMELRQRPKPERSKK